MSKLVPDGWESKPLSALADYRNGRAFKPSDWSKRGLPILRIAQINSPGDIEDYFDGDDVEDKHLIRKGDLIFSWSATLKAIIWKDYNAVLNQHIFKVEERSDTSRTYLQQLLEHSIPKLSGSSHGSTMKHIRKGVLDEFQCVVPPVSEQNKIASILTSVDKVIENTQKQIDKLQDLKKATMNELLTKGTGHTKFKDSELGEIPKNWEIWRLGDVSKVYFSNVDKKYDPNEIPVFLCNYMDVYQNSYIKNGMDFMVATAKQREIDKFSLEFDDVIITKDSETPKDIAVSTHVTEELKGVICGYHLALIRSDKSRLSGGYLSHLFSLNEVQRRFYRLANGSTRFGLTAEAITDSLLPIPPLPEQKKIASILTSVDETIENTHHQIDKLQDLKKSLMQDLLTGKVRVKVN